MKNSKKQFYLPKDFAERWIAALRSGNYKQGKSKLCTIDSNNNIPTYCCLGVAGAICGIPDEEMNITFFRERSPLNTGFFPADLAIKMGYPEELLLTEGQDCCGSSSNCLAKKLSILNDNDESFLEIANWIETNIEFYSPKVSLWNKLCNLFQ